MQPVNALLSLFCCCCCLYKNNKKEIAHTKRAANALFFLHVLLNTIIICAFIVVSCRLLSLSPLINTYRQTNTYARLTNGLKLLLLLFHSISMIEINVCSHAVPLWLSLSLSLCVWCSHAVPRAYVCKCVCGRIRVCMCCLWLNRCV